MRRGKKGIMRLKSRVKKQNNKKKNPGSVRPTQTILIKDMTPSPNILHLLLHGPICFHFFIYPFLKLFYFV